MIDSLPKRIAGPTSNRRLAGLALTGLAACGLLTGCSSIMPRFGSSRATTPPADTGRPDNVYTSAAGLPATIRRVAVLPLGIDESRAELADGRDALDPILTSELVKVKKFEVVHASADDLKNQTGSANWTGEEALPLDFLASLQQAYGCDAVLFSRLTVFHGYPPLAIGWRMKLVDARTKQILWAGDEVYDSGEEEVRDAARRQQKSRALSRELPGGWVIQNSPQQFGRYTVAQLLATLPAR